jgi:outer membrane murein-binding lipoprotein Lpp
VSRQDCKEARARIGQLVDKVKDLEKEVKCQKDMTAAQKKKVDDLQHERLEKERAFGSTNGTSATEHETRERCEELLRECALKDQIISLLQTENKSARMVQEAKSRDLDAKVAQLEAKLSAMSKCRDEGQPPSSA